MKKNNKGFSMIELIIVIAILGILTGMSTLSINYLKLANTRSAAKKIDSTLSKLKIDTMSKNERPYLYVYNDGGKYYMLYSTKDTLSDAKVNSASGGTVIGGNAVEIQVEKNDTMHTIGVDKSVRLGFKKGNGAFLPDKDGEYCTKLKVKGKNNSKVEYTIILVKDTGKHYFE